MSDEKNPFDDMVNAAQKMAQALNPSLASLSSKEFEAFIPQMPKAVSYTHLTLPTIYSV